MTPTDEMVRAAAEAIYNVWAKNREVEATWEECVRLKHSIAREAEEEGRAALSAALAAMWQDPKLVLPKKPGLRDYEYVDCLILYKGEVLKRPWNCEHLCWDDEHYDDFFCHPTDPTAWTFLPAPSQLSKRDDAERDSPQEA